MEKEAGFNSGLTDPDKFVSGRDDFGLPKFIFSDVGEARTSGVKETSENGEWIDAKNDGYGGLKGILKKSNPSVLKLSDTLSPGSGGYLKDEGNARSWSNVVKSPPLPPPNKEVNFKFFPFSPGSKTVTPPYEVLMKGVEKMKSCVVGTLTKKYVNFRVVCDIAQVLWGKKDCLKYLRRTPGLIFSNLTRLRKNLMFCRRALAILKISHLWFVIGVILCKTK